jgi:hypothetical protein
VKRKMKMKGRIILYYTTHLRPNIDFVYTLAIATHHFPPLAAVEENMAADTAEFFCHDDEEAGCSSLRHYVLRLQLPVGDPSPP